MAAALSNGPGHTPSSTTSAKPSSVTRASQPTDREGCVAFAAARAGFDWSEASGVFDKLEEEIGEVKQAVLSGSKEQTEEELGDLLFTCVNLVRKMGHDSETALRGSSLKFEQRFRLMESEAGAEKLKTLNSEQMEDLWEHAKKLLATRADPQKET